MRRARTEQLIDAGLWALSGALLVVILDLSLGPAPSLPAFSLADKVGHAAAYAALLSSTLLAAVWRPGRGDGILPSSAPLVVVACVAFGGAVEVAQGLGFHRDADVFDLVADAIGSLLAFGSWLALRAAAMRRR